MNVWALKIDAEQELTADFIMTADISSVFYLNNAKESNLVKRPQ